MPSMTAKRFGSDRKIPELVAGDHLDQKTFHERYQAMPEDVKAELIEGVVYMASAALRASHGSYHSKLIFWLETYCAQTPGIDVFDNTTTILGEFSEPQPDISLAVLPEFGGQSRINDDGYCVGAPEFTAEVALSSESYDLHEKLRDYERAGVQEYLVIVLRQQRVIWYARKSGKPGFVELSPERNGIIKSAFFGGLWLDPAALFRSDRAGLRAALERGFNSPEHKKFVEILARGK